MVDSKKFAGSRAAVPAALAVSLITACGVEDRPLRTGSAMADAVQDQAESFCRRYQECATPGLDRNYGNYDECVARNVLENRWLAMLPGFAWTVDTYKNCSEAEARVSCETFVYHSIPQCTVPGRRPNGESCQANDQCTSLFCKNIGYACGTCADALSEGATCDARYGCGNPDLNCESDNVCRRPSAVGERCSDTQSCDSGLTCYQGSCIARLENVGDSCNADLGLLCNFTEKGMSCGTTTGTCFEVTAKRQGESCAVGSYCAKLGLCTTDTQVCAPGPNDRGVCGSADGLYCEWPAACVSGSCQLPDLGSRCAGY